MQMELAESVVIVTDPSAQGSKSIIYLGNVALGFVTSARAQVSDVNN